MDKLVQEDNRRVARGAGLAFLGKLGALIEPISIIAFAHLYGAPMLGVFMLLWGYVGIATSAADLAMTTALQRFIPATDDEDRAHSILKGALLVSTCLSVTLALLLTLFAPWLATHINADPAVKDDLAFIIAVYAWAIPLWCFIEVSTAALRARGAFGPGIKVRVFYEQGLRLLSGVIFYFVGFVHYGLFSAHLFALATAGVLSLRLVGRYYDLRRLWKAPLPWRLVKELVSFATPMTGSNMLKEFQSNFPIFVLNFLIPGAAGATAVAVYAVARKVVSTLQVVCQSFEYVIAPLAAAKNALAERRALQDMYAYSTRLIWSLFLPASTVIILLRHDIVALVGTDFHDAGLLVAILALGRAVEAGVGPSQALLEMLARSRLSLLNGIAGFIVTTVLILWLTPAMGPPGAALATAIGINIPSVASLVQLRIFYGLSPYDRRLIQPFIGAVAGCGVIALLVFAVSPLGLAPRFAAAAAGLFFAFVILLRYGYSDRDAATFGRFSRRVRY